MPRTLIRAINASTRCMVFPLEGIRAGLASADAHDLFEVKNEYLPVADLAGVSRFLHRFNDTVEQVGSDRRFDLHLGQEIDDILRPSVQLGVPLLPPESLDLGNGDALHADCR